VKSPWPVILASASPRRQELLKRLIPEFSVVPAHLDEDALTDPDPVKTARDLAAAKARAVAHEHPDSLVIGGDTVVALPSDGAWTQLTKPVDEEDAVRILSTLSGRTHTVTSGVALVYPGGWSFFAESSEVTFRSLSPAEIRAYIATGDPMDKAGAYGLQGGARDFIAGVKGSVDCVIGLPTERLEEALRSILKKG
jgi:septum formation protein